MAPRGLPPDGYLEPCESDKDCRAFSLLCDPAQGCVHALEASTCPAPAKGEATCSAGLCGATVTCETSLECPVDQVCDTATARCVQCLTANDCADAEICVANACTPANRLSGADGLPLGAGLRSHERCLRGVRERRGLCVGLVREQHVRHAARVQRGRGLLPRPTSTATCRRASASSASPRRTAGAPRIAAASSACPHPLNCEGRRRSRCCSRGRA